MRRHLPLLAALLALAGCARIPLGAPSPATDNIVAARSSAIPPLRVGTFVPAPGRESLDRSVSARGSTYFSPVRDSLAAYLQETLATDLRAAGLLDPNAPVLGRAC